MLYVLRQADEDTKQYDWYVGGMKPRAKDGTTFTDVTEVYADGPELAHIRKTCTNIPDAPNQGYMVWRAPFAQFVYDSLVYVHGGDETAHYRSIG